MAPVQIRFFDLNRFEKRNFEGFVACFHVRQIKVCEHVGKQDSKSTCDSHVQKKTPPSEARVLFSERALFAGERKMVVLD
jgi:hypothetical protein